MSEDEQVVLAAAVGQQQSAIRRFLGMEGGAVQAVRGKQYRVATSRLLQALDHVVYMLTGMGFEGFATADTKIDFLDPSVNTFWAKVLCDLNDAVL